MFTNFKYLYTFIKSFYFIQISVFFFYKCGKYMKIYVTSSTLISNNVY